MFFESINPKTTTSLSQKNRNYAFNNHQQYFQLVCQITVQGELSKASQADLLYQYCQLTI